MVCRPLSLGPGGRGGILNGASTGTSSARGWGPFDALLVVSFGGPEGPDEVLPFLENVLRGRPVPRARMLEVAEHYQHFGGVSPLNAQNRTLIEALKNEFAAAGITLPIYFGNRNWHPLLPDTVRQMRDDGVRHALAFVTSPYSSYSSCRQYRENLAAAQSQVGPDAPGIEKLRTFFNHPGFIEPWVDRVSMAIATLSSADRRSPYLLFTAHSIPLSMANGCDYARQLQESCRLIVERVGAIPWALVYQSRSGSPQQPWLGPDVGEALRDLAQRADRPSHVLVVPVGFLSDHMEVLFDLEIEAAGIAADLELPMTRVATLGAHPRFVRMIRELIEERAQTNPNPASRPALGRLGASHDICPMDCCLPRESTHA